MNENEKKYHPYTEDTKEPSPEEEKPLTLEEETALREQYVLKSPTTSVEHKALMERYLRFAEKHGDKKMVETLKGFISNPAKYEAAHKVEMDRLGELTPAETEMQIAGEKGQGDRYKTAKEVFATDEYLNWKSVVNKTCAETFGYPERLKASRKDRSDNFADYSEQLAGGVLERLFYRQLGEKNQNHDLSPSAVEELKSFNDGFNSQDREGGSKSSEWNARFENLIREIEDQISKLDYLQSELQRQLENIKKYPEHYKNGSEKKMVESVEIKNQQIEKLQQEAENLLAKFQGAALGGLVDKLMGKKERWEKGTIREHLESIADLKLKRGEIRTPRSTDKALAEEKKDPDLKQKRVRNAAVELMPALNYLKGGLKGLGKMEEGRKSMQEKDHRIQRRAEEISSAQKELDETLFRLGIYEQAVGHYYDPASDKDKSIEAIMGRIRLQTNYNQGMRVVDGYRKEQEEIAKQKAEEEAKRQKEEKIWQVEGEMRKIAQEEERLESNLKEAKNNLERAASEINGLKTKINEKIQELKGIQEDKDFLGRPKRRREEPEFLRIIEKARADLKEAGQKEQDLKNSITRYENLLRQNQARRKELSEKGKILGIENWD